MDPGILTKLLNTFSLVFTGGYTRLLPEALSLLGKLAAIELVLAALWWAVAREEVLVQLLYKFLWIGAFIWLVSEWSVLTHTVVTSFIQAGLLGAGGVLSVEDFSNPSTIAKFGLDVTAVLFRRQSALAQLWGAIKAPHMLFLEGMVALGIVLCFFWMALQIFVTLLEFYLVSMLALILVPFGVFRHTGFIAERAFGMVIAFGIKLMVLACIVNALQPVLETSFALSPDPSWNEVLSLFLGSLALALLVWHAPGIAAGMMAGAPSLTASTAAHTAVAAGATMALAGVGTAGALHAVTASTRTALRFGSGGLAAYRAGGIGGVGQLARAQAAYSANHVMAGFRGAVASGRVFGANYAAIPVNPGVPTAGRGGLSSRLLVSRIIPPPSHPQGGMPAPINHD